MIFVVSIALVQFWYTMLSYYSCWLSIWLFLRSFFPCNAFYIVGCVTSSECMRWEKRMRHTIMFTWREWSLYCSMLNVWARKQNKISSVKDRRTKIEMWPVWAPTVKYALKTPFKKWASSTRRISVKSGFVLSFFIVCAVQMHFMVCSALNPSQCMRLREANAPPRWGFGRDSVKSPCHLAFVATVLLWVGCVIQ